MTMIYLYCGHYLVVDVVHDWKHVHRVDQEEAESSSKISKLAAVHGFASKPFYTRPRVEIHTRFLPYSFLLYWAN